MLEQKIVQTGDKIRDFEESSVKSEVVAVQNNKELSPEQRQSTLDLLVTILMCDDQTTE